ncbi:MAG: hypothetical protein LBF36_01980 [Mycoplasmataceae bacterium]|nr:hypothetical protein [Mycoplasmataceae bacterium]
MKKVKIIASDHNPVQVGDGVVVSWKTKTSPKPKPGPKPMPKPRKSLDERIAEAIVKTVPSLINEALKPVMSRLDNLVKVNKLKE